MDYKPQHAARALTIMEHLSPLVSPRVEYRELIAILREPQRWKDAHALFNKIRVNITLPSENHKKQDLDAYFAYVAENAAKTAYNCSGCPAPFDEDSFEWLLKCEKQFNDKRNEKQAYHYIRKGHAKSGAPFNLNVKLHLIPARQAFLFIANMLYSSHGLGNQIPR